MHSIYQGKRIVCKSCGEKYYHPLCDIYEYEGVDRFFTRLPETEVGYCNDCNKFVCIQKGIRYDNVKRLRNNADTDKKKGYYDTLSGIMQGKDSLDSCVICNGTNIKSLKNTACPSCGGNEFLIVDEFEHGDIVFHFSRKYIKPLLCKRLQRVEIKNETSDIQNEVKGVAVKCKSNVAMDVLKWVGILPVSIIAWIIVYWVINLLYNVFSPVEMTQWAITIMSSGGSGMAFVLAGSWIAPKGKKTTSIVLATIMGVFSLISVIFAFMGYVENGLVISIISTISTIVGCVLGSIQMHDE